MLKVVQSGDQSHKIGDEVLIHVRYLASGEIMTIDKCPAQLTAQEWRDLLLTEASTYYQTFAGGRGFFRLRRHVYEAVIPEAAPMAAE